MVKRYVLAWFVVALWELLVCVLFDRTVEQFTRAIYFMGVGMGMAALIERSK